MTPPNVKDLLLAPRLDPEQVVSLLGPYGFKDPARADANLQAMAEDAPARLSLADILEELLDNVSRSADPDRAMNYFERYARAAVNKIHFFSYLKDSPRTLEILAKTLGGSPYMAEILIRDPHYLYWVTDPQVIHNIWGARKKREIEREILRSLKTIADERKRLDYLRVLKRRETLRIGVRDLLRLCSVEETLIDLSNLAETLISAAHWICSSALRREYGIPGKAFGGFTILAMGKLGGGELNFSSDVDLIYLYASDQEEVTEGATTISASEYFRRLCQKITLALSEFTGEGYVYRVDLRLRPEGKAGNIAYSLDGFERYYQSRGETWERLALLKAWPVAGDRSLGRKFLEMARPFIYDRPFDLKALEEVRNIKRKIDLKQKGRQRQGRNVKLGAGGIREIELIVQALQVCHGARTPQIRERNTMKALVALRDQSIISAEECETLAQAYVFLRDVENKLQVVDDAQTHSLPIDGQELAACARRLGHSDDETGPAAEHFMRDYHLHTGRVNRIFQEIFSGAEPRRFSQSIS
jgi:[glutamine synthetase] adenylyltransferase / [glutamine synthetase]-adenylyl-L-tyrosine phosphorylase